MAKHIVFLVLLNGLIGVHGCSGPTGFQSKDDTAATQAATKVSGLVVHLGCGDGRLTASLLSEKVSIVHGLDGSAADIAKAREHIQDKGLYGKISVEQWDESFLPYVDNMVNLLVVEDAAGVSEDEQMRVVVPGGTLLSKRGKEWTAKQKPARPGMDEWTHYRGDASSNAVANDQHIGPFKHLQWTAGPGHTRSHEFTPSIMALVMSGGRIFYVEDRAASRSLRADSKWCLVARDANNGLLLWTRELTSWFTRFFTWGGVPRQFNRKLVAVDDTLYFTPGYHASLIAIDAATGKTLREYPASAGAEEIILHRGTLVVAVREVTPGRVESLEAFETSPDIRKWRIHDGPSPLAQAFYQHENKAKRAIVAYDAGSGDQLWRLNGPEAAGLESLTLSAYGGQVLYQTWGGEVISLGLNNGEVLWRVPKRRLRMACEAGVVCIGDRKVSLLSRQDGSTIWEADTKLVGQFADVEAFFAGGSLWIGGFKPYDTGARLRKISTSGPGYGAYYAIERDILTGKALREITTGNPGHHNRCYQVVATDKYIMAGRRGTELMDLESGDVFYQSWARGICKYGIMPANGLSYLPPNSCGCYISAKLIGFNAVSSARSYESNAPVKLEEGKAYGKVAGGRLPAEDDWPTYRADPERSGYVETSVSTRLAEKWNVELGGTPGAPTIAGGLVFVPVPDHHQVVALNADTGKTAWRFTAGGRIDSPPTIHEGLALFGCRDGHIYAVRASDGVLAWRFRPAGDQRRLIAGGQLESVGLIHGAVLVDGGELFVTVGRSSYLDGGIGFYRLDSKTGRVLAHNSIYSPDPETGKQPDPLGRVYIPGSRNDILSIVNDDVFLQDQVFTRDGVLRERKVRHVHAMTGFLDGSWPHRAHLVYGEGIAARSGAVWDRVDLDVGWLKSQGYLRPDTVDKSHLMYGKDRVLAAGRLLVKDDVNVYGYGRRNVDWSNEFLDGPYRLFARGKWETPVSITVRALVLAGDVICSAGDGKVLLVSKDDGKVLAETAAGGTPIFDGMAAANGRLFLSMEDGRMVCLGE